MNVVAHCLENHMDVLSLFGGGLTAKVLGKMGGALQIGSDGFITAAVEPVYVLELRVKSTAKVVGIKQMQRGGQVTIIPFNFATAKDGWSEICRDIRVSNYRVAHTKPGDNDLRVALVDSDGTVLYVQFSIVCQDEMLWLVHQVKGSGQFYRSTEGQVVRCTGIRDELQEVLKPLVKDMVLPKSTHETFNELEVPREPGTAVVEWFDQTRQVGCLNIFQGEDNGYKSVAVHWRQCPERSDCRRRYLEAGEQVSFKGLRAHSGSSSFKEEAYDIGLLNAVPVGA